MWGHGPQRADEAHGRRQAQGVRAQASRGKDATSRQHQGMLYLWLRTAYGLCTVLCRPTSSMGLHGT